MLGVRRVEGWQLHIVQEGQFGAWLQHPEHLLEELLGVDGVGEDLHLVQGVEGRIREGQRVVVVAVHEAKVLVHFGQVGVLHGRLQLGTVEVQPCHVSP